MAVMSGQAFLPAPPGPRSPKPDTGPLFASLVVSAPRARRSRFGWHTSVAAHAVFIGLLVLVPILWPSSLPEHPDYIRALLYDPPPPPPPPLPRGAALAREPEPPKPVSPDPERKPILIAEIERPRETELKPEIKAPESEQEGSPTGSELGMAEGMEEGVEGGVPGGVPGGVLGGVVGGTGEGPVLDYDQPPRLIKQIRPQYPQEAFVKKIEGTVILEILIDAGGRVVRARILQSVPSLDAAAVQTVYQWVFAPAIKHGRPVATLAHVPVRFQIL